MTVYKGEVRVKRESEQLIIDGNAIYELDLECVRKKQREQKRRAELKEMQGERQKLVKENQHTDKEKQ